MAGTSLLTLLDDIAALLDDISLYSKLAAKKTAGVLGDDLALNAEQVSGIRAEREIPVVWAVAKGALLNKLILVPLALLISYFIPWLVIGLLMIGGVYLCYEGFEKVFHKLFQNKAHQQEHKKNQREALKNKDIDMVAFEKNKIKGAIRTDFILSAEIIVLTLGTVKDTNLWTQLGVLTTVAFLVTVVVYGLVVMIVKLDDMGLYLLETNELTALASMKRQTGRAILMMAPYLMKLLSIVGTAAMFLVGGGIIVHYVPQLHHLLDVMMIDTVAIPTFKLIFNSVLPVLYNLATGILVGAICVLIVSISSRVVLKSSQ